jgi:hypothetical protein
MKIEIYNAQGPYPYGARAELEGSIIWNSVGETPERAVYRLVHQLGEMHQQACDLAASVLDEYRRKDEN